MKIQIKINRDLYQQIAVIKIRDGNPNPTNFLDPERIRNRIQYLNLNCGLRFLSFTTFVAFKTKFDFHSIFYAYFRLG